MDDTIVTLPPFEVSRTYFSAEQLGDHIGWGQEAINLLEAWKHTKGRSKDGRAVRVAVLDTGVDRKHYESGDLAGRVSRLEDATGRGPWDSRSDGHGSHCLGIVGANEDGRGVVGFAPECDLISVRVMSDGAGMGSWVARGIGIARHLGAQVISLSLGSPGPDPQIHAELSQAAREGIFVVAAAGNSGRPNDVNYPAKWPFVLAVAALAKTPTGLKLAPYSSRGPEVDIAAPGSDITSCWVDGGYATISGTSMATPAVAGAVALMIARHWDLGEAARTPLRSLDDVISHLKEAAIDLDAPGRDHGTGWGMYDMGKLLARGGEAEPAAGTSFTFGGVTIRLPAAEGDRIGLDW